MMRKNSFNIDNEPNWSNPIHIDSFEDDTIGELFDGSGISFESKVSKRKGEFDATPSSKKSKSKPASMAKEDSLANIINDDNELLMNEEEIQALSDSFSDSFDDESGDDSVEGEYDLGDEDNLSNHGGKGYAGDKKSRGNYACSKCGLPKRGHVCVFQPRNRRRGGMIGSDMSEMSAQRRLRIAEGEAMTQSKFLSSNGPVARCDAQAGSDATVGPIAWEKRASEVPPPRPQMVSTGTQCSLDTAGTVRELYLDAQGFPESYANGIISDPSFDVRTARTITVSRPAPKSYKPKVTTASSGAGPDSTASAPLLVPPFVAPTQNNRTLPMSRGMDLGANFLQGAPGLPLANGLAGLGLPSLGGLNGNPLLSMNHLALLMNSYQLQNQSSDEPIDPALASLFFPSSF